MHPRRVVRANQSKSVVRSSEVHSILIREVKHEVYIIPDRKDYIIPVVCQNSLINLSRVSNPILVISKCSGIIPEKFKAVKFTLE